jgi:hypothetical protein
MSEPFLCPECAEEIDPDAPRCALCGAILDDEPDPSLAPLGVFGRRVSVLGLILGLIGGSTGLMFASHWLFDSWSAWRHVRTTSTGRLALEYTVIGVLVIGGVGLFLRDLIKPRERGVELRWVTLIVVLLGISLSCVILLPLTVGHRHHYGRETAAIGALKTIGSAQALFREADKEGDGNLDYGTLQELRDAGRTGLIDSVLGSGTKQGYLFDVRYSVSTSEFLWFATARPILPDFDRGGDGDRYFATNHEGVTFYTTSGPIPMNDRDCTMPPGLTPVGW